jgi:hypothetical protein
MLEPAHTVITICGGYAETARMAGRSEVRIRRWEYTKEKGGTGGLIPADCQQVLLDAACAEGKDLRPEHFFARAGQPAPEVATPTPETPPSEKDAA